MDPARETRESRLVSLLLAAVTVVAYGPIAQLGFVNYDDPAYVSANPHVLAGLGWSGIVWAFTTTAEANWHPVTWLSLMLDASIGGAKPGVYHATNLVLHVVNTLLLFGWLRRTTGERWKSAFVAALFAVHPLHVESVAWVAERKDVLSTTFWMLTVAAYARWVAAPSGRRYAAIVVLFALGLMTKPMLVTLPVMLLLLDYWPLRRWDGADARRITALLVEKTPLFLLAAASALVTLLVQRPAMQVLEHVPFGARVANALVSVVAYVGAMLWPVDLAVIYPYPRNLPVWQPIVAAAIVVAISLAAIRAGRSRPWLPIGWLFYLIGLAPVLGLVQVGYHARADRFTYVPMIGLFIIVAWGVPDLVEWIGRGTTTAETPPARGRRSRADRRRGSTTAAHDPLLGGLAIIVVLVLAACTWRQVGYWRSSIDLFTHTVAVTADNGYAHYNLSTAYQERGDVERTLVHLREALRINPRHAEAHFNLTRLMMKQGNLDEAAALVREGRTTWPSNPNTFVDLGVLAVLQGRSDEAIEWFTEALRLSPDLPDARHNLEALQAQKKR